VFGAAVSVLLITFYVLPFQSATGALRDGGRLDWLTGEALLALGWAVLYVPWGVAAYKMIGRSYRADEGRRP